MDKLLSLLEENARYKTEELAVMLGLTNKEVEDKIQQYEKSGVIRGYKALIDKEKISQEYVVAIIELKVMPKKDFGFDEIAKRISQYEEVEDVYLMSGGYDLAIMVSGKTFKDIALFVSARLALLDSVISTSTHFVLTRYKEKGIAMCDIDIDERGHAWL